MKELLENYSIQSILIFIVLLALAIKGCVSYIEWIKGKVDSKIKNKMDKEKEDSELKQDIEDLKKSQQEVIGKLDDLTRTVGVLVDSDKDDIKAYITREHHYFCYQIGYIDDYNLDCIERRYSHYKEEGGNSFVADLMGEIRALPKKTIEVTPYAITAAIQKKKEEENKEN